MEVCHWRQRRMPWMTQQGGVDKNRHQFSFTSSWSCWGSVSGRLVATCVDPSVCFLELQQGLKSRGSIITSPKRPLQTIPQHTFCLNRGKQKNKQRNPAQKLSYSPPDISAEHGYLFQYDRSKNEKMEGVERLCLDSMSDPSSDWLL